MQLSIICPIYNESDFIDTLLPTLLDNDIHEKEILLIEGGSTDDTRQKIAQWQKKYPSLKLIDNPQRYVSHGFNAAFKNSKGKFIAFIGAHAIYPPDYFSNAIHYLESGECDVVGGPLLQKGKTLAGQTIAFCMSSKFGVGNTEFRTSNKRRYVQSVAFAVYKREVFEKVGLLDEELIRNQDDEFHYRLNKYGFKILMVPELQCTYYVRDSMMKLFSQYFQYGKYKPLVLQKVHSGFRLRHIIPLLFVLYLLTLPFALLFTVWICPLFLYVIFDILFSLLNGKSLAIKLYSLIIFPVLHISYGAGFLRGIIKFSLFRSHS